MFSKVEAVKTPHEKRARKVTYAIIKPGEPELHIIETNTVRRIYLKGKITRFVQVESNVYLKIKKKENGTFCK